MPEVQDIKRADDPLALDEDGLELPDEYATHTGNMVVRTRSITIQAYRGGDEEMGSPLGIVFPRHFGEDGKNDLPPGTVSLKKFGEDAEVFAVDV